MDTPFRLYGSELSPYSVKVRSYLRFKKLPFEWLQRSHARQDEFARFAKLPLIPLLVDASDNAMQDSTPIIEALEAQFPEPTITPADPALAFLAALIEDYADEWLNKAMFHYRWSFSPDQQSAARRIVEMLFEGMESPEGIEDSVRMRMTGRLHHVGSSAATAPIIEASFQRLLSLVEPILAQRPYLFGGSPCLADFGLAGQLAQLLSDPTPGAMLRAQAPHVVRWVERMESPDGEGDFVEFAAAAASIADLLRSEVADGHLAWMSANAEAVEADATQVVVSMGEAAFTQRPQRYAAKALAELRRKRAAIGDHAGLAALLGDCGCDAVLFAAPAEGEEEHGAEMDADSEQEASAAVK
jgi:glutathione S-transferase